MYTKNDVVIYYTGNVQALRYSVQTVENDEEARPISPDMLRVVYIRKGHCTWVISGVRYSVSEGDIILLNNTEQRYQTDISAQYPIEQEVIRFTPIAYSDCVECLPIFFDRTNTFSNVFSGNYPERERIIKLVDWLREEASFNSPLRDKSMLFIVRELLISITRAANSLGMANPSHSFSNCNAGNFNMLCNAVSYIKQNLSEQLSASELASRAGISRSHFSRLFNALMGMTIPHYVRILRISKVRELTRDGKMSILDAIYASGFGSASAYYKAIDDLKRI